MCLSCLLSLAAIVKFLRSHLLEHVCGLSLIAREVRGVVSACQSASDAKLVSREPIVLSFSLSSSRFVSPVAFLFVVCVLFQFVAVSTLTVFLRLAFALGRMRRHDLARRSAQ